MNTTSKWSTLVTLAILTSGCGSSGSEVIECTPATTCLKDGVQGRCTAGPTDKMYCTYPDNVCPSMERWGLYAGEGLASLCYLMPDGGVSADTGMPDSGFGIPVSNNQVPDLVLGQIAYGAANIEQNGGSTMETASTLSLPSGVAALANRLWVFDAFNARIVQWNAPPTANGEAANVAIGQSSLTAHVSGVVSDAVMDVPRSVQPLPRVVATSTRVIASECDENRVLAWATPTASGSVASLVLGQTSFTARASATGATGMNCPAGLWTDGAKLLVADRNNNRVLVWTTMPTSNGAAANLVLGQPDFATVGVAAPSASSMTSPEDVFFDGTRLFVVDTGNHRIMVWNSMPTSSNAPADFAIGQVNLTSGSANRGGSVSSLGLDEPTAVLANNGSLFVSDKNNGRVLVYTPSPTGPNASAQAVLGQPDLTTRQSPATNEGAALRFSLGVGGLAIAGDKLYVVDFYWSRVLRFALRP